MRITIVSMDTRGGVQPYVALARGLVGRGHAVRAIAPSDLTSSFDGSAVEIVALDGSVEEVLRGAGGAAEKGALASIRLSMRELPGRIEGWTRTALAACRGSDLVLGGVGGMVVALSVAEKLGVPFVEAHLQPIGAPTAAYPAVMLPGTPAWLGGWATRASHRLSELAIWKPFEGPMMRSRERVLGLSGRPMAHRSQPVLYAFSRHVVPVPTDAARARHVTGYWFLDAAASFRPEPRLEAFLGRGGPVISVGFGSMGSADPAELARTVVSATRRAGARAVLLSGWGGLRAVEDDDVLAVDSVPHDWLFTRVAATVHHGGAGTTGAALRAGIPTLVVPFTMDQPFWGSRVAALGVGPLPIPRRRLTEDALARALSTMLTDVPMRARAAALGEAIRAEDGVGAAIEVIERLATH